MQDPYPRGHALHSGGVYENLKERIHGGFVVGIRFTGLRPTGAPRGSDIRTPVNLRIAVLPILDGLPVYVAEQEGLFKKQNLNVEIIPVGSGPERDQLIAAGQADAMINEMVSAIFLTKRRSKCR